MKDKSKRKAGADRPRTDFGLAEAIFLHAYPGYTLETIGQMDETQFNVLYERIPHVYRMSPEGVMAQKL